MDWEVFTHVQSSESGRELKLIMISQQLVRIKKNLQE